MQFALANSIGGKEAIAQSANPMLRQFQIELKAVSAPLDEAGGKWTVAGPVTTGGWTAVGYYFGKKLQQTLNAPVGLINASYGGTYIEAWTSADALATDPDLKAGMEKVQAEFEGYHGYEGKYKAWQEQYKREDHSAADASTFASPNASMADWKAVTLPGMFSKMGLPNSRAIWFRRTFTIPPEASNQAMSANHVIDLRLGEIHDSVKVYWNGHLIGQGGAETENQRYNIKANLVQEGTGVLAIRIFNAGGNGGGCLLFPKGSRFVAGGAYGGVELSGEWLAKPEYEFPPLDPEAQQNLPQRPPTPHFTAQNVASYLFNGMIHPLIPAAMTGVIWYQGEANNDHPRQYQTSFPLMISDWRAKWGRGDFPFYFCQLPGFTAPPDANAAESVKSSWGELREAQTKTLSLPNTGEAVLIDVGDPANIHPPNKVVPGERLARIALARVYGQNIVDSGPVFDSMSYEGNAIRIHFRHAEGGLVSHSIPSTYNKIPDDSSTSTPIPINSPGSDLQGFVICGSDGVWKWATAKIDGESVLVSADGISSPWHVRYAWAQNPICNLYNREGLPAEPFRTDNFAGTSDHLLYGAVTPTGAGAAPTPGASSAK